MIIFWQQKLVYLAMPKSGSTAFETALSPYADIHFRHPPNLKHATAQTMRGFRKIFSPEDPTDFEQVAMMREPVSWLGSWYRYRQRPQIRSTENSTSEISFDEFVHAVISRDPPPFAQFGSQIRFLCGNKGFPIVDRIFAYEDIGRLINYLERRLNVQLDLPRANESPAGNTELRPQTLEKLMDIRADEFELYAQVASGKFSAG